MAIAVLDEWGKGTRGWLWLALAGTGRAGLPPIIIIFGDGCNFILRSNFSLVGLESRLRFNNAMQCNACYWHLTHLSPKSQEFKGFCCYVGLTKTWMRQRLGVFLSSCVFMSLLSTLSCASCIRLNGKCDTTRHGQNTSGTLGKVVQERLGCLGRGPFSTHLWDVCILPSSTTTSCK